MCNISSRADLDPIYYCELLRACPVKDDGDAEINSVVVHPRTVPKGNKNLLLAMIIISLYIGSKFNINVTFTTVNGTGTGEIDLVILTQDGIPLG